LAVVSDRIVGSFQFGLSSDLTPWWDAARFGKDGDSVTPSMATLVCRATTKGVEAIKFSPPKTIEENPAQFFRVRIKR
jgi:hypothetical protein